MSNGPVDTLIVSGRSQPYKPGILTGPGPSAGAHAPDPLLFSIRAQPSPGTCLVTNPWGALIQVGVQDKKVS